MPRNKSVRGDHVRHLEHCRPVFGGRSLIPNAVLRCFCFPTVVWNWSICVDAEFGSSTWRGGGYYECCDQSARCFDVPGLRRFWSEFRSGPDVSNPGAQSEISQTS